MTTLFETCLKLTGYDINLASNELKRIQSLPLEEFRKWQDEKKWWIAIIMVSCNFPFFIFLPLEKIFWG